MKTIPLLMSKTKLMRGYRCLKSVYLTVHHPELEAPITPDLQALFDQGHIVGKKAQEYFPGGTLIDNKPWDFSGALHKTRELIANGARVIYEAAFEFAGCYARADIIQFSETTNRWKIFEVKSSTKVKPEHYDDVGLQAWIMAKSGLALEQINIVHLNTECHFPDLTNLFTTVDVTDIIRENYLSVQPKIREILKTLREFEIPNIDIGPHCQDPNDCGFIEHCWKQKEIPTLSVFNLPQIRQKKWDLYYNGIIELDDPRLIDLNPLQERVVHCYQTKERYIDRSAIQEILSQWQYPFVYLDFETINPAIPCYEGCKPFEHVPFQFSVHVQPSPNAPCTHHEFLHDTADDPRKTLIPALLKACGDSGTIVAYFGRFEAERIEALANYSPPHRDALLKLAERIKDPLPIIRDHVYDNAFGGSFSLKKVAPALLGEAQSYDGMEVSNGNDAQRAFIELISNNTSHPKKAQLKKAMLDYCKKDTEMMVELVKWLLSLQNK